MMIDDIAQIADISGRHRVTCRARGVVTGEWCESYLTIIRRGRVYPVGTLIEYDDGVLAIMACSHTRDTSYTRKAWERLEAAFGYPALPAYEAPRWLLRWDPATD